MRAPGRRVQALQSGGTCELDLAILCWPVGSSRGQQGIVRPTGGAEG